MTTDAHLVRDCRAGRKGAADELVRRWAARVMAFCHARTCSADAAEDLAQETLLRAIRGLDSLRDPEKFGTWLLGIAQRVCLDWRRRRRFATIDPAAAGDADLRTYRTDEDAPAAAEAAEESRRLLEQIERLPESYREVLMLYYYDDLTYQDLAEMLGVSKATINARLTKARALLRARLNQSVES